MGVFEQMQASRNLKNLPILKGYINEFNEFLVWCPFCKRFHYHGNAEGHRCAHCHNPNSPFDRTGYIIKRYTKRELKQMGLATKEELEMWKAKYTRLKKEYDELLSTFCKPK